MRCLLWCLILFVASCGIGCRTPAKSVDSTSASPPATTAVSTLPAPTPVVTLGSDVIGAITSVHPEGRFVVLSFPVGVMPTNGTVLAVYRQGVKSAEIRVTGPQRDTYTVADVVKGDCIVGDQAKAW